MKIKQGVIPSESSEADKIMTNKLTIPRAPMPASPKIKDSPAQKRKESFRIQGSENKENKPANVVDRDAMYKTVLRSQLHWAPYCGNDSYLLLSH